MPGDRNPRLGGRRNIAPINEQTETGNTIALTGRLQEFRTALDDEIKAAKSEAYGRAVPLVGGRRIARAAQAYQYIFHLKTALSLPDDLPGELRVPSGQTIDVTVVSVDGMTVILSSKADLGDYVSHATLSSDLTFLLKKLITRIEELSTTNNCVGDRILANIHGPASIGLSVQPTAWSGTSELNGSQQQALESSLNENLTFIWGPPGTGKTKTIAAIGQQLRARNRSLLMVSHTNAAVDGALIEIAKAGTAQDPSAITNGKILRVGVPKDERLRNAFPDVLLQTQVERRSVALASRLDAAKSEYEIIEENVRTLRLNIELDEFLRASSADVGDLRMRAVELAQVDAELEKARTDYVAMKPTRQHWSTARQAALVTKGNIQRVEVLETEIADVQAVLAPALEKQRQLQGRLQDAQAILRETQSVNWIVRMWRGLPSVEAQQSHVAGVQQEVNSTSQTCDQLSAERDTRIAERMRLAKKIAQISEAYGDTPERTIQVADEIEKQASLLFTRGTELHKSSNRLRSALRAALGQKIEVLRQLDYITDEDLAQTDPQTAIEQALISVRQRLGPLDLPACKARLAAMMEQLMQLRAQVSELEAALANVEALVISEADIVGTTLTRAYTNEAVRARRYDTMILDEASMAPIPAIWVAASLADQNAVIVGDFKQLPPILLSTTEAAKSWLGRDVFQASGVAGSGSTNFIALDVQYRMDPAIAEIPKFLFYNERKWQDGFSTNPQPDLGAWLNVDWQDSAPVILVDTGPLNAWVTSVPRGKGASRLNFLSATLCVDLCHELLKAERPEPAQDERRIFIECPYQPHAELVETLLQESSLETDVKAGTIHAFQGSEADVVILDLVNDEPHWRVGIFMRENDPNTRRMLNVAITRARRRLIVVGDFSYAEREGGKAFLGGELIPYLKENYPLRSALEIAPPQLLTRAAEASRLVVGGEIEPADARMIVTQDDFYPLLIRDAQATRSQVVIYSPFLTQNRIAMLQPTLLSAQERGVRVYVITKPLQERPARSTAEFRFLERSLEECGVMVIHKRNMHEKLVFLDDDVLWSGSLNPLSHSDTQEVMERRADKTVVSHYARVLRLAELVGEFSESPPRCPVCGSEMVASEGRDDPYFWRCIVDDCYSRSIDDPRLRGGKIVCSSCQGELEYGEWGGKPSWRCIKNRHHHQRLIGNHLKLQKMKEKVPLDELPRLETLFGLAHPDRLI